MLLQLEKMSKIENKEICSKCKGKCCKRHACDCLPCDFNFDINLVEKALESGKYSIDFERTTHESFISRANGTRTLNLYSIIRSRDEVLYVRPRNQNRPIVDIIHSQKDEGPCVFWSLEKGCELSYEQRPTMGKVLLPMPDEKCVYLFSRDTIVEEWRPYTRELFALSKKFFDKNWYLYQELNFKL